MPRAIDPRAISTDRMSTQIIGGPIADFGWRKLRNGEPFDWLAWLKEQFDNWIKGLFPDGIDLDLSWVNDWFAWIIRLVDNLFDWFSNPFRRAPNLLINGGFEGASAIAPNADWSVDELVFHTETARGSAVVAADGVRHAIRSNIVDVSDLAEVDVSVGVLTESGFGGGADALRLELVLFKDDSEVGAAVIDTASAPSLPPVDWVGAPAGALQADLVGSWKVPDDGVVDSVCVRCVVSDLASGGALVRFDNARLSARSFLSVVIDCAYYVFEWLGDLWTGLMWWMFGVGPDTPHPDIVEFTGDDARPFSKALWDNLVTVCTAGFDDMVVQLLKVLRVIDPADDNDRSLAAIILTLLRENPVFGWVVKIAEAVFGYAGSVLTALLWWFFGLTDAGPYGDVDAHVLFPGWEPGAVGPGGVVVTPEQLAKAEQPFSRALWDHLVRVVEDGFRDMAVAVLEALGVDVPDELEDKPLSDIIRALLIENPVIGWLFKIAFAVTDWIGDLWTAVMRWIFGVQPASPYADPAVTGDDAKPFSRFLWDSIVTVCTSGFDAMVIEILEALGFDLPDDAADRSLARIIRALLIENPVVGWLFKIGFAVTDWIKECWDAVADWFLGDPTFTGSADDKLPFSKALWDSLVARWRAAWDVLVAAINDAIAGEVRVVENLIDMIVDALRHNPVFGWLFVMVEDWLRPVLNVVRALQLFGDRVWNGYAAGTAPAGVTAGRGIAYFLGHITTGWSSLVATFKAAWQSCYVDCRKAFDPAYSGTAPDVTALVPNMLSQSTVFGWFYQIINDWLKRIIYIGKAVIEFGDAVWQAVVAFGSTLNFGSLASAVTSNFRVLAAAIFTQTRPGATEAANAAAALALPTPGDLLKKALQNNPVVGWVFALDGIIGSSGVAWKLVAALWDFFLGGSLYNGTAVTGWSSTARTNLLAAWTAFLAKVAPSLTAPTTSRAAVGTALANSMLSGLFEPVVGVMDFFALLKDFVAALYDYFLTTDEANRRYTGDPNGPAGDPALSPVWGSNYAWSGRAGWRLEYTFQQLVAKVAPSLALPDINRSSVITALTAGGLQTVLPDVGADLRDSLNATLGGDVVTQLQVMQANVAALLGLSGLGGDGSVQVLTPSKTSWTKPAWLTTSHKIDIVWVSAGQGGGALGNTNGATYPADPTLTLTGLTVSGSAKTQARKTTASSAFGQSPGRFDFGGVTYVGAPEAGITQLGGVPGGGGGGASLFPIGGASGQWRGQSYTVSNASTAAISVTLPAASAGKSGTNGMPGGYAQVWVYVRSA